MIQKEAPFNIIALVLVLVMAGGVFAFASNLVNVDKGESATYGITFSVLYADQLEIDYEQAYLAMIDELGVRNVRLPFYWSDIERDNDVFSWDRYDRLVKLSEEYGVSLTPVVGMKVPRWPECFVPDWAEQLNNTYQHQEVLDFIQAVVERYKDSPSVVRWQVENEPFFPFGECPEMSNLQFQERVDLVRSLDNKPIQVTVSGEVGFWHDASQAADILGISMYRQTWNDLFGYFMYPLSPEFYYVRAVFVGDQVEQVLVSELQAEPWFPEPIETRTPQQWYKNFTVEMFDNNLEFVEQTQISEAYLWGAEWWYYLKQHGESRLWDRASEVFFED